MNTAIAAGAEVAGSRVVARMLADWDPARFGWDWGTGIAGHALLAWHHVRPHRPAVRFLKTWIDHHLTVQTPLYDPGGRLWKIGPGLCVLHFWRQTRRALYRARLDALLDYLDASPRWDGTRLWLSKEQRPEIWVDSLMTTLPFLARTQAAGLTKDGVQQAEAQLLAHAAYLEDEKTGLWHHAYHLKTSKPMGAFWSRGMGWALLAMVEVLGEMALAEQRRSPVRALLRRGVKAVLAQQDEAGRWFTVMDRPDSFCEISGQALLVYALARALHASWLPREQRRAAWNAVEQGWRVVNMHVAETGQVTGVSTGTAADSYTHYLTRKTTGWTPWGPAAVVLAANALRAGRA